MKKIKPTIVLLSTVIMITTMSFFGHSQSVDVNGTLQKWHKVTVALTLQGNNLSESANTFRNTRMDVVFTSPSGKNIRVPGFFAADGNAANTNATQGKIYKAYLRPDETGSWTYRVLYYRGNDIATRAVGNLPAPEQNITGNVGNVSASNKTAPDLRAKGRLQYQTTGTNNQRRYLKFAETGEYFLKIGPDSPENFLNYNDFDNDAGPNINNGFTPRHSYTPHAGNFAIGNPTWDGGKGRNIIGALNYVKDQRMNSVSMSLFGGDDKNVVPWVNRNTGSRFTYDVSKLEQWEIVMSHAEQNGLLLHLKLAENENWNELNSTQLKTFYREMIARFGHHLAVEWNFSEEYRGTPASAIERIDFMAANDPWQNPRVIHTYPGEHSKYTGWINLNAKLTGASVQSGTPNNYNDAFNGGSGILTWINNSKNANQPWVVASDEQNPGSTGIFTSQDIGNSNVKTEARTRILWKTLMAGGQGVMWYGGGQGDFKTENFNRFGTLFNWSRIAFDFFKENNIEFWKAVNSDNLISGNNNHCLAEVGKTYVIYLENGGTTNLNLNGLTGNYTIKWYNPRNGGSLVNGNVTKVAGGAVRGIGNPPNTTNQDWVALVRGDGTIIDPDPNNAIAIPGTIQVENFIAQNGQVKAENTPGTNGGQNLGFIQNNNYTEYDIDVATTGTYTLNALVSSNGVGGNIVTSVNGNNLGTVAVAVNNAWHTYVSVTSNINLTQGPQKLRFTYTGPSGFLFNFESAGLTLNSTPPPSVSDCNAGPTGFILSSSSETTATFSFDNNPNDTRIFELRAFEKGTFTGSLAGAVSFSSATAGTTTITSSNLQAATAYDFVFRALCVGGTPSSSPLVQLSASTDGSTPPSTGCGADYQDNNGLVVIEAENLSVTGTNWQVKTAKTGFTGAGHLEWTGGDFFSGTQAGIAGVITTKIKINSPGKYKFEWRNSIASGTSTTDLNDSWLRFPDASDFYGEKSNGERTYPRGETRGRTPFPEGQSGNGYFKLYVNNLNWSFQTSTGDNADGRAVFVEFATAGIYTMEIAARSSGHVIDRIVLHKQVANALALTNIETPCSDVPSGDIAVTGITITPTTIAVNEGQTTALTATVNPTNATNKGVTWSSNNTAIATVNANGVITAIAQGSANITATTLDGAFTASTTVTVATIPTTTNPVTTTLSPIQDSYLQGAINFNNTILRVESGNRVSYLQFDLSSIAGTITKAELKMTCNSDAGNGNVNINLGNSNNWTETNLSNTNKPAAASLLGNSNTSYSIGSTYTWDLATNALNGGENLSLLITQTNGNDVAFASKENTATAPQLIITYTPSSLNKELKTELETSTLVAYPNPVSGDKLNINLKKYKGKSHIRIYDAKGVIVYENVVDKNNLVINPKLFASKGFYILNVHMLNTNQIKTQKLIIK